MGSTSSSTSSTRSSMPNPSALAVQGTVNLSGASAKPVIAGMVAPGQLGGVAINLNRHPPLESVVGGERFLLKTKDGFSLDALYVEAQCNDEEPRRRGALCFHGNGMYLDSMGEFASFYLSHNVSVLLVTMRGYPGSEGDVRDEGEPGIYLDVASSVDYMITEKKFRPIDLIAHGFSLGGSLASAAAVHHDLGALVLDHTFTSASAVSQTSAVKLVKANISQWIPAWMVSSFAEGAMDATFPSGLSVDLGRAGIITTDGLSSVDKVKQYNGLLVVCYGTLTCKKNIFFFHSYSYYYVLHVVFFKFNVYSYFFFLFKHVLDRYQRSLDARFLCGRL